MKRKAIMNMSRPIPERIQRTEDIVDSMTGNPNFPTPSPTLEAVITANTELSTAYSNALGGGLELKAIQRSKDAELKVLLRSLIDYVNGVAQGDEDIVLSSGFEISKIPQPIGKMPQVTNLYGRGGDGDGTATLKWLGIYGAKTYTVEMSEDGVVFTPRLSTTRSRNVVIDELEIGRFYFFRVAAIGAAGQGAFSNTYKVLAS